MGRFDGKVALVSGGARGQGGREVERFAEEGARVVVGDVLKDAGEELAGRIGDAARFVSLDVTSPDSWGEAVRAATDAFGRLDVLVNNAGVAGYTPIIDGDVDEYLRIITVNQLGVYLGMRAAAPAIKEAGGGAIVNISSIDGIIGMPGLSGYVSSKFAVRGLTKVAALELARYGIRVNSVHPGYIDTPMIREPMDTMADDLARSVPLRRLGTPSDIADMVLFLASDASSYCTGAEFVIDGGVIAGHSPAVG
ncbi:MAG TPA: glucose 1-dehydrogenase [Acidimicrobiales bacterium]|nr:glucose 1-dehydrogenase [Acidimicrobiales bacterium]